MARQGNSYNRTRTAFPYLAVLQALILISFPIKVNGALESSYSIPYCISVHGINNGKPVTLNDGTVADCIADFAAIEVDFARKYYECGLQAVHYANQLDLFPVCVLITETIKDCEWYRRAIIDIKSLGRDIKLIRIGPYECN